MVFVTAEPANANEKLSSGSPRLPKFSVAKYVHSVYTDRFVGNLELMVPRRLLLVSTTNSCSKLNSVVSYRQIFYFGEKGDLVSCFAGEKAVDEKVSELVMEIVSARLGKREDLEPTLLNLDDSKVSRVLLVF